MYMQEQRIDGFVNKLWQFARLRAYEPNAEVLLTRAKQVKNSLRGINALTERQQIGEALTACILNFAVQHYARASCGICQNIPDCPDTDSGPCARFAKDTEAYTANLVLLYDAIFSLDGAYGFNGGKMVAVISSFLEELNKNQ